MAKYSKPFEGDYPITSKFGMRGGVLHDGIDFGMPENTPIYNVDAGRVVRAMADQHGGLFIDIVADSDGGMTRYLHLNKFEVKPGDWVATGQRIGLSGNTGLSTGPHLHFGVFNRDTALGGRAVDPSVLFKDWANPSTFQPIYSTNPITARVEQIKKETHDYLSGLITLDQVKDEINVDWKARIQWHLDGEAWRDKAIADLQAENAQLKADYDKLLVKHQELANQKQITIETTPINPNQPKLDITKNITMENIKNDIAKPKFTFDPAIVSVIRLILVSLGGVLSAKGLIEPNTFENINIEAVLGALSMIVALIIDYKNKSVKK